MYGTIKDAFKKDIEAIKASGLYKAERVLTSKQGPEINTTSQSNVLNFCANNYLGLSAHPKVVQAGVDALNTHGFGLSSVRFICGTQDIHKELEEKTAHYLGMEDCILYAAAFDANGGLFEPLLGAEDAVISDALNHASIIDGIRLCKAKRFRYTHNNMESLEEQLIQAASSRRKLIVTDGSFSMDGTVAQLDKICDLADKYDALVMIDECHSTGFLGATGRGVHEHHNVIDRVDIITGTYGKALGGASGGFTAARKEIVDILRQHSRPYLFSNTLAPAIVGATLQVLDMISDSNELRDKLEANTSFFRSEMTAAGFDIVPGIHPIVPIMLYDAPLAQEFSEKLLEEGIYVIGFFFPVVPKDKARIRVQLSAAHEKEHIQKAINAFIKVGKKLNVI
ncbi:MAG: glycine C-acetyltransferase [Flavobacteriaceae bacterium]|jgi:glycine C-acetyltransferase|nr:glycine C-acetyltransferase [Flavobacteriaceae bacterium]MDA7727462.1 glycine C-acetyltransferase [Flavobacteriaceae bacterium]MDG1310322.1 glycine C-acetyltransferase [Flavobacteriaceae bacterium]